LSGKTGTFASDREVLAREATGDDASVWNKACCSEFISTHFRHVLKVCRFGELVL
jgi:hypothetical protein